MLATVFVLLFFASCGPDNSVADKEIIPTELTRETLDTTGASSAYDTLSFFSDVSHSLSSTVKVDVEVQPLVDYGSEIVNDYYGTIRFRFTHNDKQYVKAYSRKQLEEYDAGVCADTIMLVGNDTVQKKCSFIVQAGRYGSDNLFNFYIVLNYSGEELLFECFPPCDLGADSRFGYSLTCKGLYRLEKKINIPDSEYPLYMTLVDSNTVFLINGEETGNAAFYDLKKKTFINRFSFDGIYEALNTYTNIGEWQKPYRLIMLNKDGLIRVFSAAMQEWKIQLTDLPSQELGIYDKNVKYFYRDTVLILLRMDENGLPVAWKKE